MHYSSTSVRRWLFTFLTSLKLLNRIWRNLTGRMALYQVNFFLVRSEKQDGHPDLWLAEIFSSPLKLPNGIPRWNERKQYLNILDKFVFGADRKTKTSRLGLPLAETFSTLSLTPLNRICWRKNSMSSTKFVVLGPIRKARRQPWHLIGWYIINFLTETTWLEFKETW